MKVQRVFLAVTCMVFHQSLAFEIPLGMWGLPDRTLSLKNEKEHVNEEISNIKHLISPHSITLESNIKFIRIEEMMASSRSSWLLNKFSL